MMNTHEFSDIVTGGPLFSCVLGLESVSSLVESPSNQGLCILSLSNSGTERRGSLGAI